MDGPMVSFVLAERAHGINGIFRVAVLLHARTIETNRAIH